jgi:hypothetical protein
MNSQRKALRQYGQLGGLTDLTEPFTAFNFSDEEIQGGKHNKTKEKRKQTRKRRGQQENARSSSSSLSSSSSDSTQSGNSSSDNSQSGNASSSSAPEPQQHNNQSFKDTEKNHEKSRDHIRKELVELMNMKKPTPHRLRMVENNIDDKKVDPGKYTFILVVGLILLVGGFVWGMRWFIHKRSCQYYWHDTDYTKCFTKGPPCSSKALATQKRHITQHVKAGGWHCTGPSKRHIACNKSGACEKCKRLQKKGSSIKCGESHADQN